MAINMELENTVFLIAPVQFSVVRILILFIKILHILSRTCICFFLLISWDFAKFYIDCMVLRDFWSISRNSRRPALPD